MFICILAGCGDAIKTKTFTFFFEVLLKGSKSFWYSNMKPYRHFTIKLIPCCKCKESTVIMVLFYLRKSLLYMYLVI